MSVESGPSNINLDLVRKAHEAFLNLPEETSRALIEMAQEEARRLQELVQSGKAGSLDEAIDITKEPEPKLPHKKVVVRAGGKPLFAIEEDGRCYPFNRDGSGEIRADIFLGDVTLGAYKKIAGMVVPDKDRYQKNFSEIWSKARLYWAEPAGHV